MGLIICILERPFRLLHSALHFLVNLQEMSLISSKSRCASWLTSRRIIACAILLCTLFLVHTARQTRSTVSDSPESEFKIDVSVVERKLELIDNPDIQQNDDNLIEYIRKNRIFSPPQSSKAKQNAGGSYEPSEWGKELRKIFGDKENGFFVECGANNGEFFSNTYHLEKRYGWTGLLIEANPFVFPELRKKNRNAWISDACLSLKPYAQKVKFIHRVGSKTWYVGNGMIQPSGPDNPIPPTKSYDMKEYVDAGFTECFPLFSLLQAINVTVVDYFSLDVEGVEFKILKYIPFDRVTIKVISIEFDVIPEGKEALLDLLAQNGYEIMIETYRELFMVLTKYKHEFLRS